MKDKLVKIINHYGIDKQLKYIHTEYFELDQAILDCEQFDYIDEEIEKQDIGHIAEEIADIMVMLKQFQYYYCIEDQEIEEIMEYKVDRQLQRIENE